MLRHLILLVFFCGLCSVNCQQTAGETSENDRNEIKKNNVGANGPENSPTEIIENNFRNPVLEYLFRENNSLAGTKKGVVREIRHSQTLLLPGPRLGFHKTSSNGIP
ncbi:hypothetical protein RUM43_011223 [Polyplax serrata]|uniref:Uncharacterized protein n=1 Tax=Polyplax serrata TaxID=468196 RepID=A0AAN8NSP6_POLSC